MKKYSWVIFLLFFAVPCEAQSNHEMEVQESVKQFFAAFAARDSIAMKRWATADLTLIEYGTVWNLDTIIRKGIIQNTALDFHRTDRFEFLSTTVRETMALVSYRLTSQINANGKQLDVQWIESVSLLFEDNRWKLRLLHSTLLNRSVK